MKEAYESPKLTVYGSVVSLTKIQVGSLIDANGYIGTKE